MIRIADGASSRHFDVRVVQTRIEQLISTDLPEVKVLRSTLIGPESRIEFLFVVYELGAAWPKRRANSRQYAFRSAFVFVLKEAHHLPQYILYASAPAAMDIGYDFLDRVNQKDCLTVSHLDKQTYPRHLSYQRIAGRSHQNRKSRLGTGKGVTVYYVDSVAVNLLAAHQHFELETLPDHEKISVNIFWNVSVIPCHIEGIVRRLAESAMAREKPMDYIGHSRKAFEQK